MVTLAPFLVISLITGVTHGVPLTLSGSSIANSNKMVLARSNFLLELLKQCRQTDDGISRNCCALVYPKIKAVHSLCRVGTGAAAAPGNMGFEIQRQPAPPPTPQPLPTCSDGCHPLTKNVHPLTQRLLDKCCYIPEKVAIAVGLDCLALTFPSIPDHQRCGQCPRPDTILDFVHTCCTLEDGFERDCCSFLSNPNVTMAMQSSLTKEGAYCPCPKSIKSKSRSKRRTELEQDASARGDDDVRATKCHPATKNLSSATEYFVNKCCRMNSILGGDAIDCLELIFPSIRWNQRCGYCRGLQWQIKEAMHECCATFDGRERDCCAAVNKNVKKNERFCPCRSHGLHGVVKINEEQAQAREVWAQNGNGRLPQDTCPPPIIQEYHNLDQFPCSIHHLVKERLNVTEFLWGNGPFPPDDSGYPCLRFWGYTLQQKPPTIQGQTDYLDYEEDEE